jgi:membrane protein
MARMGTTSRHSPPLRRRLDPPSSGAWRVLADACGRWQRHGAPQAGAALAFHASCALGCALLTAMALLASMPGAFAAPVFDAAIGPAAASTLRSLLMATSPHAALAAGLGALGLLAAAAAMCAQLRRAMNLIQQGPALPSIVAADVAQTLSSFAMVLVAGGLVLMSLFMGVALSLFAAPASATFQVTVMLADAGLSSSLLLPAAGLLLRWLPDPPPAPLATWKGAATAGLPIVLCKLLLAGWIAGPGIATPFGAVGTVLLTMLWVYAAAQLLLLGAAVTAGDDDADGRARHVGARPLRAPPERVAANTPLPAAPPTSLAAARARLRPHGARAPSTRAPGVLLQFPAARRGISRTDG